MGAWWKTNPGRVGSATLALAVAAGMLSVARRRGDVSEFAPPAASTARSVADDIRIRLYTTHDMRPVYENQRVRADASFTGTYSSFRAKPTFLVMFAVDAMGTVHPWVPALEMTETTRELPLPSSLVLKSPAAGAIRFYAAFGEAPMNLSEVEQMVPGDRTARGLRERFTNVVVREWTLSLTSLHDAE